MPTASRARPPRLMARNFGPRIARLREVDDSYTSPTWAIWPWNLFASPRSSGPRRFSENRGSLGIAWGWNIPVLRIAIVLIGGLTRHQLAGLGHEASHYSLLRNKSANDLVGNLSASSHPGDGPFISSLWPRRVDFTDNPALDQDLVNLGPGKCVADFPRSHSWFILTRMLSPPRLHPLLHPGPSGNTFPGTPWARGQRLHEAGPSGDAWVPRPSSGRSWARRICWSRSNAERPDEVCSQ